MSIDLWLIGSEPIIICKQYLLQATKSLFQFWKSQQFLDQNVEINGKATWIKIQK